MDAEHWLPRRWRWPSQSLRRPDFEGLVGTDITVEERARIETTLAAVKAAMQRPDREAIQRATHELNAATKHLAEVMMNRSVREALTGKSVDSV